MEEAPAITLKALVYPYFVISGAIKTLYFRNIYDFMHLLMKYLWIVF